VKTGFIDITCEDDESIVVIELKAGVADSPAIGQILGYIGDLMVEEEGRKVKGILVAHDFDKRCKSAARAISGLTLKKYAIDFSISLTE
jgi:RecB family endonuclease NucS